MNQPQDKIRRKSSDYELQEKPVPESLDDILQSITDGILVVDLQKRILYANSTLANSYQLEPANMVGRSCEELIGFDHCKNCPHEDLVSGGESYTGHSLKCDRFDTGPFCVSATPYLDSAGQIQGIVEIYRDMRALGAYIEDIESKNVELECEKRRLDQVLTDSSDGYFTASLGREVLSANQKLLDLLGKSKQEVIGRSCPEVFGSDKCDTDCPILWARENKKNIINCHERILTGNGIMPVDKSILLHQDPNGQFHHVIGVIRNVSEIVELRRAAAGAQSFRAMVSRNRRMEEAFDMIRTFGPTDTAVLIQGESGTGKELVARAVQEGSPRKEKPFRKINCSALAEGLLESELFGHVRGAFTGATQDKRGLFEVADGGTLFLDEVADMSPKLQTKILRVLEEQEFEKVGGTQTIQVDVRIIAASNRNLKIAIREGQFREDLYYRLNAIQIKLPPLRERREDIPLLVELFLENLNQAHGRGVSRISARALDMLQGYAWPGNIRELRNAIEFAYVCAKGDRIERQDLPEQIRNPEHASTAHTNGLGRRRNDEKELVEAMRRYNGDRNLVSRALGISRTTLWRRLKQLERT